jgi:hypothetical protein
MADVAKELQKLVKMIQGDSKNNTKTVSLKTDIELPFEIGGEYFIRTVTYHLTGRVIDIVGKFLVLEDAAWIADSGRFNEFFKTPSSSLEVEPFGDRNVFVNTDSITDATTRGLLLEVK